MSEHTMIPEHTCPKCGYKSDCVSMAFEPGTQMPVEGDITMCLNCGGMFYFTKDLQLRFPTEDEKQWLMQQGDITQLQIARAHIVGGKDLTRRKRPSS